MGDDKFDSADLFVQFMAKIPAGPSDGAASFSQEGEDETGFSEW